MKLLHFVIIVISEHIPRSYSQGLQYSHLRAASNEAVKQLDLYWCMNHSRQAVVVQKMHLSDIPDKPNGKYF